MGEDICAHKSDVERKLELVIKSGNCDQFPQRNVDATEKVSLKQELTAFRTSLFAEGNTTHHLAGGDITSGFHLATCEKIVDECQLIFTLEQFQEQYSFYENSVTGNVFQIVQRTLADCPVISVPRVDWSDSSDTTEESE